MDAKRLDEHDRKTKDHRHRVDELLVILSAEMKERGAHHDESKLLPPEREAFAAALFYPYGTEEYYKTLNDLGPALQHHFENNRHHPEYFARGVNDMNLVDVMEMLCDWKAAAERSGTEFVIDTVRYSIGEQLRSILMNTYRHIVETEKTEKEKS